MLNSILNNFKSNPLKLFLVDGIGALVSAFFLGVVLIKLNYLIGLPENILLVLSAIACAFALYSFSCYRFLKKNFSSFILIIATSNLIYCLVTICILFIYREELLPLGFIYFISEKIIVLTLIYLEFRTVVKLKSINQ